MPGHADQLWQVAPVAQRGGLAHSWGAVSFPDVPGVLPTRYLVMAGTPEKILEHLLEFMRLDATLYDPVGRWGVTPSVWGPHPKATLRWAGGWGQGATTRRGCLLPNVQPQKLLLLP